MLEIGARVRDQPPPPHAVFEALTEPLRPGSRRWLVLLDDEHPPAILESRRPDLVVWGSIWDKRPDARIRFDLGPAGEGTALGWTLLVDEPSPEPAFIGHLRKRVNELINRDLRLSFGQ